MSDETYGHQIICPRCGEAIEKGSEYEMFYDDDRSAEIECDNCDVELVITRHVHVAYSAKLATVAP